MSNDKFTEFCKKIVADYFNKHVDVTDRKKIAEEDVYIVWCCKTLQNNKALASTVISDGMYYEITYNGDKGETYVDVYKKWENFVVSDLGVGVGMLPVNGLTDAASVGKDDKNGD